MTLFLRLLVSLLALTPLAAGAAPKTAPPPTSATVYLFLATDCPIAGRYGPRLARLVARYPPRRVRFVAVFPNVRETEAGVRQWMRDRKLAMPVARASGVDLARRLGARTSPEAVLCDARGKRLYRGRIDDSDDVTRVKRRELTAALDAVLAGKPVPVATTPAFGCALTLTVPAPEAPVASGPTYYQEVAPIIARHCVACHRPGEVGRVVFDTYPLAAAFAAQIRERTTTRKMPPWKALSEGEFHDERRLDDREIATLAEWAARGAPAGMPATRRTVPAETDPTIGGWRLGKPDREYEMPEPYAVPAEGRDFYRVFVIPGGIDEDTWVKGIEFHPGNRAIVHHVSAFIDLSGAARRLDAAEPGAGYTNPTPGNGPGFSTAFGVLGGWTPGHTPRLLPPGVGLLLPKGADIVLEVHYHLSGKAETDRTRFGIYTAREPIDRRFLLGDVNNSRFTVPARAKDFAVQAETILSADLTLLSVTPHMHKQGTRMRVTAELPSGELRRIVEVRDWDFNWQPSYRFKEPLRLPKGTRVQVIASYDNPEDRPIRWGEGTDDEMCTVFFGYYRDDQHLLDEPVVVP